MVPERSTWSQSGVRVPEVGSFGVSSTRVFGLVLGSCFGFVVGCGGESHEGTGGSSACSSETDDRGCFDAACFEAPAETVSFRADVLPLFENSCALSGSCHGNPASPETSAGYQPYLGEVDPQSTASDVEAILALIVSQPSRAATSLAIVEPSAPERSFLMHKMDDTLGCADVSCPEGCGDVMPKGAGALDRSSRDLVRSWIAQGAKDN